MYNFFDFLPPEARVCGNCNHWLTHVSSDLTLVTGTMRVKMICRKCQQTYELDATTCMILPSISN